MSFWKPLIDWNASHRYHAANRSEAKWGVGIGLWKMPPAENASPPQARNAAVAPVLPAVAPGDIHGAF